MSTNQITETNLDAEAIAEPVVIDLDANITDEQRALMDEFIEDNTPSAPDSLVKGIIAQIGGWEKFVYYAKEIADFGIEDGYTGFDNNAHIYNMFFKHKADLIAFANNLSWNYDCDNVYDLTDKFVPDFGDERIEYVYDTLKEGQQIDDFACFDAVSEWLVWNAAQYVFDNYVVFMNWVNEGRPEEIMFAVDVNTNKVVTE